MVEPPPERRPRAPSQSRQTPEAGSPAPVGRDGERRRSKLAFGAREFVDAIAHRITGHLREPELEEPLVVGVFGEWGSGKSRVLAELEEHFRQGAEAAGEDRPLTLPVFFNAWRFEAEEHLIIPLLKTAEHKILDWQEGRRSKGKKALDWLRQKAEILEQASIALFYGLKGKLAVPQVAEISFDPGASLEAAKERWEEIEAHKPSPIQEMASLYYDFQAHMERLTGREDDHPGLNLVFLVDDLDRCLPEKAVQMLESIKLFLEVEGCVFVLAVDDEVVSRGISHRYRDYNENAQGAYDSIAYSLDPDRYDTFQGNRPPRVPPPITGAEYLEKIIHLPFRISRPSRLSVEGFLKDRYPDLFVGERVESLTQQVDGDLTPGVDGPSREANKLSGGKDGERGRSGRSGRLDSTRAEQLLDFFSFCVPAVPRKLIRAAELYKMLARVARSRGWDDFDPLLLARTVLLQLLAPDLYRFGRGVPTFLAVMRRWSEEVKPLSHRAIERQLNTSTDPAQSTETGTSDGVDEDAGAQPLSPQDRHLLETRDRPLLARLRDVARHRSGFEPLRLVHTDFPLAEENLLHYYRLRVEKPLQESMGAGEDGATTVPEMPEARLDDAEEFLLQLTSTDPLAWRNAVESEGERLRGRVLDDATFAGLVRHAENSPETVKLGWLSTLEPHLTGEQLTELYRASRFLPRLSREIAEGGMALVKRDLSPGVHRLRSALELLCRKVNPAHRVGTERIDLGDLGLSRPDLRRVPLGGAYLRGLDLRNARFSTDERGQLDGADLQGAALPPDLPKTHDLVYTRLVGSTLPDNPEILSAAVNDVPLREVSPVLLTAFGTTVRSMAVLQEGTHVVAGCGDGTLRVLDLTCGREVLVLEGHGGWVRSVASLSSGRAVSGGDDGTVRVWDLKRGESVWVMEGHGDWVRSVASLSSGRAVSGGDDGTVRVWDVDRGESVWILEGHGGGVLSVASLSSGRAVSGGEDGAVRVWDVDRGENVSVLEGHLGAVLSVASLSSGRALSGGEDGTVHVWDVERRESELVLERHKYGISSLASLSSRRAVSGGFDGTVQVWDLERGETELVLEGHMGEVLSVASLSSGRVVSCGEDGTVQVWDLDQGESVSVLRGHGSGVLSVASLSSGRVVSGGLDGTVQVWDLDRGESVSVLEGHGGGVLSVASLSSGRAVSGGDDGTVRVWDVDRGESVWILEGHGGGVLSVASLSSGRAVSGGNDGAVRVWDVDRGESASVLEGHGGGVLSVASLSSGRAVSGGSDGTVRVWDLDRGENLWVLEGHVGGVRSVASLSSGRVVSGGDDGTVRVWDVDRGNCLAWLTTLEHGFTRMVTQEEIRFRATKRPHRTIVRDGHRIPEDHRLHRLAGFVHRRLTWLPVHHYPNLIEWEDFDESGRPWTMVQKWPEDLPKEEIQRILGQARDPDA